MLEGLASSFVEDLTAAGSRDQIDLHGDLQGIPGDVPSLKTIAFGALTYKDLASSSESPPSTVDDYLVLRTFSIERHRLSTGHCRQVVTQIAKGAVDSVQASRENLSVLRPYWLA